MKSLSIRTENIAPSMTVAIDTLAKQMKAMGKDIVSLGAGEPDLQTPDCIKRAGISAIEENKTKYVAPVGLQSVRHAVCEKLLKENGLKYEDNQIVLTSGAKHAVFNSFAALVNPGDEIIIPTPYWVTYPELVRWFGGVPVFITSKLENGFKITANDLENAITKKTKAIVFNNPCNPSGAIYSKTEFEAIAKVIVKHDLYCISDEIYEHFTYNTTFASAASFSNMYERTILINGFSKSHCMTGYRIGYNAAPVTIAQMISKIQSQAIHHPSTPAQYAAKAAIENGNASVIEMRDLFQHRQNILKSMLEHTLNKKIQSPEGAFYLFVPVQELYGKKTPTGKVIDGSMALCSYLLESVGLAIVPGIAFGMDSCVRFSYAASESVLEEAARRFDACVKSLL